jgi:hypothetical protein
VRLAARAPTAVGLNRKLMLQLAPADTLVPTAQLPPLTSKSLPEVTSMALIISAPAAPAALLTTTLWAALVVPMFWLANCTLAGDTPTDGAPLTGM